MATRHLDITIEALLAMLQIALHFFPWVSRYLLNVNQTVAAALFSTSSPGFLFYVCIIPAATASYGCSYQTPVSLLPRMLVYFNIRENGWYWRRARIFKSFRSWVLGSASWFEGWPSRSNDAA